MGAIATDDIAPGWQAAIWQALCDHIDQALRITEILELANKGRRWQNKIKEGAARRYLRALERAKIIQCEKAPKGHRFKLGKHKINHAPILENGEIVKNLPPFEVRVWKAARALKNFDLVEISLAARTRKEETARYLKNLAAVGYIDVISETRFKFRNWKYSGPEAPIIIAQYQVLDRNNNEVQPLAAVEKVKPWL